MFPLLVGAQHYDWGRLATDSTVYKLLKSNHDWAKELETSVQVHTNDETRPFAELWVGTHPSLPSFIVRSPLCPLEEILKQQSSQWPDEVDFQESTKSLPFLLKVLSIQKTLSIQAHPDLTLAQQLHRNNPKQYPDDNHKPEMAVALKTCEVMYGFRKLEEIAMVLTTYEEREETLSFERSCSFTSGTKPRNHFKLYFKNITKVERVKDN
ncbi:Mannose-6-phosphate isomerase [Galdieria sulphuraria]|nr:Mannose-6-phosphate isomerase [Galdieria sulphuraria]